MKSTQIEEGLASNRRTLQSPHGLRRGSVPGLGFATGVQVAHRNDVVVALDEFFATLAGS